MRFALLSLGILVTTATARADSRGDALLARARATEQAQLAALAGTTLQMQTRGTLRDGKTTHTLEAMRHLAVGSDGKISNDFVWGKIDGESRDEAGLRQASGAPKKPRGQAEALTVALAPLTAGDVDVTPVGPTAGGYLLRCDVRRDAAVARIDLVVDVNTGKKLAATLHPAGKLIKLADRADMILTYADDGTPAALHSLFAARVLWVDRAADLTTTRLR
ncbi:MAG: hypothetical protein JWN44_2126 [Myxococcales bacterium]|nr:hypothetical protein [Myxococcales bacterium]